MPALICEMVDWCRAAGFEVVAAGKGTKYLPAYHESTPDTVWPHYGFSAEMVKAGDFNAQMFNSFLDGTKSAIPEFAGLATTVGELFSAALAGQSTADDALAAAQAAATDEMTAVGYIK